jgi:hypothetical protein
MPLDMRKPGICILIEANFHLADSWILGRVRVFARDVLYKPHISPLAILRWEGVSCN